MLIRESSYHLRPSKKLVPLLNGLPHLLAQQVFFPKDFPDHLLRGRPPALEFKYHPPLLVYQRSGELEGRVEVGANEVFGINFQRGTLPHLDPLRGGLNLNQDGSNPFPPNIAPHHPVASVGERTSERSLGSPQLWVENVRNQIREPKNHQVRVRPPLPQNFPQLPPAEPPHLLWEEEFLAWVPEEILTCPNKSGEGLNRNRGRNIPAWIDRVHHHQWLTLENPPRFLLAVVVPPEI
ncbi:MAG: hypothetical protein QXW77_01345 [Candidatus Hadarchaeales archaeon]